MTMIQLDKYARDARAWRDWGMMNHQASAILFTSGNPILYLPAATLGHHALEMYLKAALIREGMVVFDPKKCEFLDPRYGLKKSDCIRGHVLVKLAQQLADKRNEFDLSSLLDVPRCVVLEMPMQLKAAFELFDPFFSELRYPQALKKLQGVGEDEKLVLDELVRVLQPYSGRGAQSGASAPLLPEK
jgi:hypothetical protein